MLGVDYGSITAAGAFVLGAVLGAVATMRLTRALIDLAARARRRLDELDDEAATRPPKRRKPPPGP